MSWSDLFYPGNPGRRDEVVRLCTKIFTLLDNNARTTNELVDLINRNLPNSNISKIALRSDSDVKTNVGLIMGKVEEIKTLVESKSAQLKGKLTPDQYNKLVGSDTSFLEKIAVAKQVYTTTIAIAGSVAGLFVIGGIDQGKILVSIVSKLGPLRTGAIATVALGVLVMGIDMIASAIMGAVEKSKLEAAINELQKSIEQFEPVSYQFDRNIQRLEIYLNEGLLN